MTSWLLILGAFGVGLVLQRSPRVAQLRDALWYVNFWGVLPALVFCTFLTFSFDSGLVVAVAAAIAASWAMLAVSYVYARLVSGERDEVGALVLGAAFGNTAFIGYPLALLLFGQAGLNLAVVYDQLCFGIPMTSITPVIARVYGRRPDAAQQPLLRAIVSNPPIWGLALGLALRVLGIGVPFVHDLQNVAAAVVGPLGFLLLGLSLPLDAIEHEGSEVARALGSGALRIAGGPAMLFAVGHAIGASVPPTFYLIAATPTAFHALVLARIYDLRPALMRLQVVGSTIAMVCGAIILAHLTGST